MSLSVVSGAVQTFHSGSFILAANDLLTRVASAVFYQLKTPSEGLFGTNFSGSLAGRLVFWSAFGLSTSTFLLRYRSFPPYAEERNDIGGGFLLRSILLEVAWATDTQFITAAVALTSFIQLKNAYFVLPCLNDPPSSPSLINRACQAAYTTIKYASLTAIAIGVFQSCNQNLLYGALFLSVAYIPYAGFDLPAHAKTLPDKTLTKVEFEVGQTIGTSVASGLLFSAVLSGIVGSILFRRGSTLISGITTPTLFSFFDGLMDISFVFGFVFPYLKKTYHHFNNLDQYTSLFIKRFSFAVAQADQLRTAGVILSKSHFDQSYKLALGYIVKKADPAQKQEIIEELTKLPDRQKLIHFLENLPFFDAQDLKEYIEICGMETKEVQYYFSPEQIQIFILPILTLPYENMASELQSLKKDVNDAVKNYSGLQDESLLIYEKIHTKHKKIAEYSSSLEAAVYLMNGMDLNRFSNPATKEHVQHLKEKVPAFSQLKEEIKALEEKIESVTGDLTQPAAEALGEKGLRVDDCTEILSTLEQPSPPSPFKELSRLLSERGIQTKYDLIQKGILFTRDTIDELKVRLLDFMLSSDQLLPLAPAPSGTDKAAFVADKIYGYVLTAFFLGLQIYTQPKWLLLGFTWETIGSSFFSNNPISRFSKDALESFFQIQRVFLQNTRGFQRKSFAIGINSAWILLHLTSIGFIPAFITGVHYGQIPRILLNG
jgi:hypothetical protein